jgi:DeoR family glycerol-3-phosphate regulon repressor
VRDGDVVFLDAGTTTQHVARCLDQNRLTVASNFLPILQLLADQKNISLIGIGGTLYADNLCFIGPMAVDTIRKINANVAFLATSCLSLSKGMTNRNLAEAEVKRAMLEMAERVVLVMDSSKMHTHTLATVGSLDSIDTLVTDGGLCEDDQLEIERRGVKVLIAHG